MPTAQVQILLTEPYWTLKTLDENGQVRTVGGDELYVVYRDSSEGTEQDPMAIAFINDNRNGSYTLDFSTTPMKPTLDTDKLLGSGNLIVYFDFTCGIGGLAPPSKALWKTNGGTKARHTRTGVPQPPIRLFQRPPNPVNFSSFPTVNFIGDSMMWQLVMKRDVPFQPNTIYRKRDFRRALNSRTVNGFFNMKVKDPDIIAGNVLVIGSGVWDILTDFTQGPGFEDHLAACARLVEIAREQHPYTTLIWKSMTAMHVSAVPPHCDSIEKCRMAVLYMTASRSKFLYNAQKEVMEKLQVPFLDQYEATYLSAFRLQHQEWQALLSRYEQSAFGLYV